MEAANPTLSLQFYSKLLQTKRASSMDVKQSDGFHHIIQMGVKQNDGSL